MQEMRQISLLLPEKLLKEYEEFAGKRYETRAGLMRHVLVGWIANEKSWELKNKMSFIELQKSLLPNNKNNGKKTG